MITYTSKTNRFIALTLSIIMIMSLVFSQDLAKFVNKNFVAHATGMIAGTSGSITSGNSVYAHAGIISLTQPAMRVSLYRNSKVELTGNGGLTNIYYQMNKGQPEDLTGSMYFVTPYIGGLLNNMVVSVCKANTSNRTLDYNSYPNDIDNIITMNSDPAAYVSYEQAHGYIFDSINDWHDSFKDNWEQWASDPSNALAAWSYILTADSSGVYHVKDRVNEIFNPGYYDYNKLDSYTDAQRIDAKNHYTDFLVSLYAIASDDAKLQWEQAVNDYWNNSDNLKTAPVSVCFDTAACLDDSWQYGFIVPTMDYLNYVAGVESAYAIDEDPWWANVSQGGSYNVNPGNSVNQVLESINLSILDDQNNGNVFNRITDRYDSGDGFSHGLSAVISEGNADNHRLTTGGGWAHFQYSGVTADYLNIYQFDDGTDATMTESTHGYMLSPAPTTKIPLTGKAFQTLDATPDNEVVKTDTLGMPVTLTIHGSCDPAELATWKTLTSSKDCGYFVITTTWNRTITPSGVNAPTTLTKTTTDKLSPSTMMNFISGNTSLPPRIDDVSSTDVRNFAGQTITFKYTATTKVDIDTNNDGIIDYTITLNDSKDKTKGFATDTASFIIVSKNKISYASTPEAYSELKDYGKGSNESGTLKEDYEAMAGVPSTEQLYFAAGGSEFIVDVTLEYVKGEVAKRTYTSYFEGTDSEFKQGDTAPNQTLGGYSVDLHNGGTYTKTWTGSIPNLASAVTQSGMGTVTATCPAQPDRTAYNTDLAAAQAYATEVNGTVLSFTSASDKINRSYSSWGAAVTTNSPVDPITTTASASAYHTESSTDSKGHTVSWQVPDPCSATASPGATGSYTIVVTFTVPTHVIDGPCSEEHLPAICDTWAQTWKYDSMKITDVHVWTIDQAAVNGMSAITSADVIGADVKSGRPSIFYNIALKNNANYTNQSTGAGGATQSSTVGRVRYSYLPTQNDTVSIDNGVRNNYSDGMGTTYSTNPVQNGGGGHSQSYASGFIYSGFPLTASTSGATQSYAGQKNYPTDQVGFLQGHTDDKDKLTKEYNTFLQQRQTTNVATMLTDFLILQTSSGDQAVLYYDSSNDQKSATSEKQLPTLSVTKETMWDNNSNSSSKWSADAINVGSYNGNYTNPASKFNGTGNGSRLSTFVDSDPAGDITRTTRPSNPLMLYQGELNMIVGNQNKSYATGKAEVFWANSLNWTDRSVTAFQGITDPFTALALYSTTSTSGITGYNFAEHANYIPSGPATGGFILEAPYSKQHTKINDIIVHDPVSTEDASLVSLDSSRDQRTGSTLGNAQTVMNTINANQNNNAVTDKAALAKANFLDDTYYQNTVLFNMDFDTVDNNNNPINKVTGDSFSLPSGFSLSTNSGLSNNQVLKANGTRLAIPFSEMYNLGYYNPTHLLVEADAVIPQSTSDTMLFSFDSYAFYIPANQQYGYITTGNGKELGTSIPIADGQKHHIAVNFSFNSIDSCHVYVDGTECSYTRVNESPYITSNLVGGSLYVGSWGSSNSYPASYYMDNLKVTKLAGTNYHTDDCYREVVTHPNGFDKHIRTAADLNGKTETVNTGVSTGSQTFNYNGNVQTFVVPATGDYTLETWGAQGGPSMYKAGGQGGYAKGTITLTQGTTLTIVAGGMGSGSTGSAWWTSQGTGGYNGGGAPGRDIDGDDNGRNEMGGGGGGYTTIRNGSEALVTAGGGGGATYCNIPGTPGTGGSGGGSYNSIGGNGNLADSNGTVIGGSEGRDTPVRTATGWCNSKMSNTSTSGTNSNNGYAKISWNIQNTATAYKNGAEWFVQELENGDMTEEEARNILGPAYDDIMKGVTITSKLYTWDNWTTDNMKGFKPINQCTLNAFGGNLVMSSTGTDPYFHVPVNFSAQSITNIEVTLDNNTSSTSAQLFWTTTNQTGYAENYSLTVPVKANTTSQTITFALNGMNNWTGKVTDLRFDLANAAGTVTVNKIVVYGKDATVTGTGNESGAITATTSTVFSNSSYGEHTYSAQPGTYTIQAWGASGGSYSNNVGGKGGYSSGSITLNSPTTLYIFVGQQGTSNSSSYMMFGGGGYSIVGGAGGGASDVRLGTDYLANRIIVAGGAGGADGSGCGGNGGGLSGTFGSVSDNLGGGYPGTQTSRGTDARYYLVNNPASNEGGAGGVADLGGGGGGYYGGGLAGNSGGGGGSGYIGGVTNGITIAGDSTQPSTSGGTQVGQSGNGCVIITGTVYVNTYKLDTVTISDKSGTAVGTTYNYGYTGGIQSVTLPAGDYTLTAWGAQGGNNNRGSLGGNGAYSTGTFTLANTTTLWMAVGGQGSGGNGNGNWWAAGGGGGSFIASGSTLSSSIPLLVAGGGGGAGGSDSGRDGNIGGMSVTPVGTSGICGSGTGNGGNPGAGFSQDSPGGGWTNTIGAKAFINGAAGADITGTNYYGKTIGGQGGFGGGGSGGGNPGGGGGGYIGGNLVSDQGGYGGTSYNAGNNAVNINGSGSMPAVSGGIETGHTGNGYIRIVAVAKTIDDQTLINTIKQYYATIPDYLPDGTYNPIWACDPSDPGYYNAYSDNNYKLQKTLVCNEPHHEGMKYNNASSSSNIDNPIYKPVINTADGSFTPGNFLNIDYGFQIYFPNEGNFEDGECHGLGGLTSQRGLGFTDNKDTGTWTRVKKIKFDFNVIYNNQLYLAGQWITLGDKGKYQGANGSVYSESNWSNYGSDAYNGIYQNYYNFYCVLANYEAKSASISVQVEATNSNGSNDNTQYVNNATRGKYTALHGAYHTFYADVVGRIGNLTMEDTGDYRFSDFFKKPTTDTGTSSDWTVDGVVHSVDESKQNNYLTWIKDIRGLQLGNTTDYINTYEAQSWVNDATQKQLPLSSGLNNISSLKTEPLRVGYPIYFDISTIGNYFLNDQADIQVAPYYYALNLDTQEITPVDAYFKYTNGYEAVNIYNLVNSSWNGSGVYNYTIGLDWSKESARRNYTATEEYETNHLENQYITCTTKNTDGMSDTSPVAESYSSLNVPNKNSFILGNAQFLCADGHARTFIGGETTYGYLKNLGGSNEVSTDSTTGRLYNASGKISDYLWWQSAQRWHMTISLPSSTVFVPHKDLQHDSSGNIVKRDLTNSELATYSGSNYVILCTANINVVGNTYALKYSQTGDNGSVNIQKADGSTVNVKMPDNIPPVLAVYSSSKSSITDTDITETH